MFTIEQIIRIHSKVKSGADFPAYIRDLKQLGVINYETFVKDGHTDYFGRKNYQISSPAKYEALSVSDRSDAGNFKADLLSHQKGKTDYLTFCSDCARWGIEKWAVNMSDMTCTYFDKSGNKLLVEAIPA